MLIKNLNLSFGINQIFNNIDINIPDDKKIGVVGVNGSGKTTFFKVVLGLQEVDSGNITFFNRPKISYMGIVKSPRSSNCTKLAGNF